MLHSKVPCRQAVVEEKPPASQPHCSNGVNLCGLGILPCFPNVCELSQSDDMSFQSLYEQQSQTSAINDTATSRGASKRPSPFNDDGSSDGSRKRVCSETIETQGNCVYLSNTRSPGARSLSSSTLEASPLERLSWSTTDLPTPSSSPSQAGPDSNWSVNEVFGTNAISGAACAGSIAAVGKIGFSHIIPHIEVTNTYSNNDFNHSSYTTNALLGYATTDTQHSADSFLESPVFLRHGLEDHSKEVHKEFAEGSTSDCNLKQPGTDSRQLGVQSSDSLVSYIQSVNMFDEEVSDSAFPQGSLAENGYSDNCQSTTASDFDQEYHSLHTVGEENLVMTDDASAHFPSESVSSIVPFDTCFGTVSITFQSSVGVKSHDGKTSVKMVACGHMLKLLTSDSDRYAGILEAPALCALLQNPHVTLTSTLCVTKSDVKDIKRISSRSTTHNSSHCILRVLICGHSSEKQNVSRLLSEAEIFPQHPAREEIGGLKYDNPHFLLRPGFEMPSLEQLSIMSDMESAENTGLLDESRASLVMRVFDSESVIHGSLKTEVSNRLQAKLEEHQNAALAMMQEKECGIVTNTNFPSLWQCFTYPDGTVRYRNTVTKVFENTPKPPCGGILADEMGLGKTLSVLSLICWSLDLQVDNDSTETSKGSGMTLVVAPKSTINGWQEQIKRHIKPDCITYATFHGASRACFSKSKKCNIILTTYETLRSDWSTKKILYSQRWDRIVLDEAHHIRSPTSQTFRAACELQARHRWCLSGTPICNSLTDYGSLLTFIGVQPFADRKAFNSWILNPIREQRPEGLKRLQSLVQSTCLRRKKSQKTLRLGLPKKSERIHWIDLSLDDQEVYKFFKLKTARLAVDLSLRRSISRQVSEKSDLNVVTLINILRRICDHGEHLLPPSALELWNARDNDSFVPMRPQTLLTVCDLCERQTPPTPDNGCGCEHVICEVCMENSNLELSGDGTQCPKCVTDASSNPGTLPMTKSITNMQPSAKVLALIRNLNHEQHPGSTKSDDTPLAKSLIFSVWTKMLDLVQHHLQKNGFNIARIDGSSSLQQRSQAIKRFTEDPSCTIMLASIGSAGEGINLTAASTVHLLEPHWNPMQEAQAIDRVHRIGQSREVHVIRYLTNNSIETYVQWIQKEKVRLINQSLDSVHVSQAEIDEKRWEKLQQYIGSLSTDK